MSKILFIKTSSLGDVIHHMPALTEARRHRPNARFAWIVEDAFAQLARLHPAVDDVIPVGTRRWRRAPFEAATRKELAAFFRTIRSRDYDEVIDTQGLLRTALIARIARGRRHGYDARSIREPLAAWFYDIRHQVGRDLHAIARNRTLTAHALGYTPSAAIDYDLDRAKLAEPSLAPYGLLLHATARPEKEWPQEHWIALGRTLADRGIALRLPWGTEAERLRAERIAAAVKAVQIHDREPLDLVARRIAGAQFVIGVDTGLLHLAAALGVPLVAIFVGSEPGLTGPMGSGPIAVLGGKGEMPQVADVVAALDRVLRS
jgi:heptosyltransferase-1